MLAVLVSLALVLGQVSVAGPQKKKKDKADQEAGENLDGTWQMVSREVAGKKEAGDIKMVVKGNTFTLTDGKIITKGTYKADPSKTPKEVDAFFEDDAGNKLVVKSIYEVQGDTMRVCGAYGKDRPREFKSTAENGYEMVTYKKAK
jgi:uncharacterized protein (TIGR03067 family)